MASLHSWIADGTNQSERLAAALHVSPGNL